MRAVSILGLLVLFGISAMPAAAFDFNDARHIVTASEAQLSPDGSRVVYVRGKADFAKDRTDRQLTLIDVHTRAQRPLTFDRKGVAAPHWSSDGARIFFLALDSDEKNPQEQVFVLPMDGGEAQQITHAKNGVVSFAASPGDKRIAYATQDDNPDRKQIEGHRDAFEVHSNDYLHESATMPVHVWWIPAAGGTAHRLTSGSWSVADLDPDGGGDLSWSADGHSIAIEHFPTPFVGDSLASQIEVIDIAGGGRRALDGKRVENGPLFSPRGDNVAYARNTGGDYTQGVDLYVASAAGNLRVDFRRDVDRSVNDYTWDARGTGLWVITPDRTHTALWYQPLQGHARRIPLGTIEPAALGNAANGSLAFIASTPARPPEVYLLRGANAVALTDNNAFVARAGVAKTISVEWKSTKGTFDEDGVLTYPLGYKGGKAPLVLRIHGGPQGASGVGWVTQRQEFAAHGYFVFEPNYRGGTNMGDAFQHAITDDAGDGPGKDVMAGVAAVEKMGVVDTSRIAVSGWSYGGYMTSWLIGHYHMWKAAVSGASLDDWLDDYNLAFYVTTDVPFFRGVPWNPRNTQEWIDQSPITYAPHITTPTLIMGDISDNNVTITNSFRLYHAIKDNGTPVQFVAYPVPGHFPSDPVRNEDVSKRWLAWLDRYLK
ncbi:MAG TPA: S9 family peptidase [Candidatus Baltobacteraceae bacterium]|nr:S9 family peptidase [Candidatus Baltobacteraceae bacterium]